MPDDEWCQKQIFIFKRMSMCDDLWDAEKSHVICLSPINLGCHQFLAGRGLESLDLTFHDHRRKAAQRNLTWTTLRWSSLFCPIVLLASPPVKEIIHGDIMDAIMLGRRWQTLFAKLPHRWKMIFEMRLKMQLSDEPTKIGQEERVSARQQQGRFWGGSFVGPLVHWWVLQY